MLTYCKILFGAARIGKNKPEAAPKDWSNQAKRTHYASAQLVEKLVYSKKASQNLRHEWRKKDKSVISGGMYVGNDTSHDGRGRAAVMQPPLVKKALWAFLTV